MSFLLFMNMWDIIYQNTPLGAEWIVPVEMWAYLLILPLFFFFSKKGMVWKTVIFIVAIIISLRTYRWYQTPIYVHWAIENYACCFIGGMLFFWTSKKIKISILAADSMIMIVLLSIIDLPQLKPAHVEQWFVLLMMILILMIFQANLTARHVFENRAIVMLGNISFPFYLLHFPVLEFLKNSLGLGSPMLFICGLLISVFLVFAFQKWIEQPALFLTGKFYPYDHLMLSV